MKYVTPDLLKEKQVTIRKNEQSENEIALQALYNSCCALHMGRIAYCNSISAVENAEKANKNSCDAIELAHKAECDATHAVAEAPKVRASFTKLQVIPDSDGIIVSGTAQMDGREIIITLLHNEGKLLKVPTIYDDHGVERNHFISSYCSLFNKIIIIIELSGISIDGIWKVVF